MHTSNSLNLRKNWSHVHQINAPVAHAKAMNTLPLDVGEEEGASS